MIIKNGQNTSITNEIIENRIQINEAVFILDNIWFWQTSKRQTITNCY